ncbi:serine/threonine protein phosphatase [Thermosipho ferrireducens]|uniref:Serine/threonine protein phosphatase n=1 Tax=Thermosipho ferrireducens TaxID=2571116 RepID=A0ABX7S7B9_9BACT|nr:metallophosphoesterase family protein [Thermosipho ferrireducens]QTA37158.1 serine/threonine protein phosphatase [Thermosipho ferrireducens]
MGVYAIGDIHGCYESLVNLLDKIQPASDDILIFLGDYIDRGPYSSEVVDFLITLSKLTNCIFLRGNHEDMMLNFLRTRDPFYYQIWERNGSKATVSSYGGIDNIPDHHLNFFENTKYYFVYENYAFVHGGVVPGVPLERQKKEDLLWIRYEFINSSHNLPYIVVFGHTPFEEPFVGEDKIGIDTGCVYGGKLTAYNLTEQTFLSASCKKYW